VRALEGVDIDNPGTALDRSGRPNPVPRVTGRIRRKFPIELRDVEFLRANTDRRIKITLPGPFTMAQQAQNDFYEDEQEMVLDYAAAVNAEIKDLFAAGSDLGYKLLIIGEGIVAAHSALPEVLVGLWPLGIGQVKSGVEVGRLAAHAATIRLSSGPFPQTAVASVRGGLHRR